MRSDCDKKLSRFKKLQTKFKKNLIFAGRSACSIKRDGWSHGHARDEIWGV